MTGTCPLSECPLLELNRLVAEGADELLTNCKRLKMRAADGESAATDLSKEQNPQGYSHNDIRSLTRINKRYDNSNTTSKDRGSAEDGER